MAFWTCLRENPISIRGAAMGGGGGEGVRMRWTLKSGADWGVGLLDSDGEDNCGEENSEKLQRAAAAKGKDEGGTSGEMRRTRRESDEGDGAWGVGVLVQLCGERGPAEDSCNKKQADSQNETSSVS